MERWQPTPHELKFLKSLADSSEYPSNLIIKTASTPTLQGVAHRLTAVSNQLFCAASRADISVCDISSVGEVEKTSLKSTVAVDNWLGVTASNTGTTPGQLQLSKIDPQCRMIFLSANGHSRAPLKITREMLVRLFSYHQITHHYVELITVFGRQHKARHVQFSSFAGSKTISRNVEQSLPRIQRSGNSIQLSFNLKSVAEVTVPNKEWSVRQAAIYHRFDLDEGKATWVFTQGHTDIRDRVTMMLAEQASDRTQAFSDGADCFKQSLKTCIMLCEWSAERWRQYVQELEDELETETDLAVYRPETMFESHNLVKVQWHEETADKIIVLLDSNATVLESLHSFYKDLQIVKDCPLIEQSQEELQSFLDQIKIIVGDSKLQIARARLLVRMASNRKSLILQHLQNQAAARMEVATNSMHKLGMMAQKETIAMRVIAFVTLVYLPATFVSTFFSTDVIKYQGATSFSLEALVRWLQVTIPLTAITGLAAFVIYRRETIPLKGVKRRDTQNTLVDGKGGS